MNTSKVNSIIPIVLSALSVPSAFAAISYEDHFYSGGPFTNTAPATGNLLNTEDWLGFVSESNSALRWQAQGAWNWAAKTVPSEATFSWPTGSQTKSIEWKVGPLIVTSPGNEGWADVQFQMGLYSANGSRTAGVQAWSFNAGAIQIELNRKGTEPTTFANLTLKNDTLGGGNSGLQAGGQTDHGIDPTLSHLLRLELTETEVRLYVDNTLSATALLADYDLSLGTGTEFANGFFFSTRTGRVNNGEGLTSVDRITMRDSTVATDITLPTAPVYPPPSMEIARLSTGLHIINNQSQYRRQQLRTTGSNYSWVGGSFPKTYSFTIKETPQDPSYEVIMYFAPYADYPNSFPDNDRAHCAVIGLGNDGGSGANMHFGYKRNAPGSNGFNSGNGGREFDTTTPTPFTDDGNGGRLATVNSPTGYVGTWSITFTSATDFSLAAPGGATSAGTMLPASSNFFVNPMMVTCGSFVSLDAAGRAANPRNEMVISNITMSGVPNPINESFTADPYTPLLTNAGETNGADFVVNTAVSSQLRAKNSTAFWLLQESTDLGLSNPWSIRVSPVTAISDLTISPLPNVEISASPKKFWRLALDAPLAQQAPCRSKADYPRRISRWLRDAVFRGWRRFVGEKTARPMPCFTLAVPLLRRMS
jgi:hypothetical protein